MRYVHPYLHMSASCHMLRDKISTCWVHFLNMHIEKRKGDRLDLRSYPAFHPTPIHWISGNRRLFKSKIEKLCLKNLAINSNQKLEIYGYTQNSFCWGEVDRFEKKIKLSSLKNTQSVPRNSPLYHDQGVVVLSTGSRCGDWLFLDKDRSVLSHIIGKEGACIPDPDCVSPLFAEGCWFVLFTEQSVSLLNSWETCRLRCYEDLKKQESYQEWKLPFNVIFSMQIFQKKLFFFIQKKNHVCIAMASIENVKADQLEFVYSDGCLGGHLIEVNREIFMINCTEKGSGQIQKLIFDKKEIRFAPLEIKRFKAALKSVGNVAALQNRLFILGEVAETISKKLHLWHINLATGELEGINKFAGNFSCVKMIANPEGRIHLMLSQRKESCLITIDLT